MLLFSNVTAYVRFPGNHWDILTRPAEGTWTTDGTTAVCNNFRMEPKPCDNGDSFTSEWFFFSPVPDCVNGLNLYSAKVGELAGVKRMRAKNPVGYCTWYYYGGGIYPDAIHQNLDVYDANREDLPIRYVQIDDGWQDCTGDWNNNKKIPDMGKMADEIRARGYTPAIWIPPYVASEKSKVFQEHPDWFVHAANSEGWPAVKGAFDCSHPDHSYQSWEPGSSKIRIRSRMSPRNRSSHSISS